METYLKELEAALAAAVERFEGSLQAVRSNRPSVQLVEGIKVECYGQPMAMNEVGTLSIRPPREIDITVWDKGNVNAVVKAIENAKIGLSVTNNDNVIRASLPPLTDERRAEITKLAKKMTEEARIQIRSRRDEALKKLKAAEERGELTEDGLFKAKERVEKAVGEANKKVEALLDRKLKELYE